MDNPGQAQLGCSLATRCLLVNEILPACLYACRTPQTGAVKPQSQEELQKRGPTLMQFHLSRRHLGGILRVAVSVALVCVLVYIAGTADTLPQLQIVRWQDVL